MLQVRTSTKSRTLLAARAPMPMSRGFFARNHRPCPRGVPIPFQPREIPHRMAVWYLACPSWDLRGVVLRQGVSEFDKSWEPLATLYRDAPTYIVKQLTSRQLPLTTKKAIFRRHDIHISSGAKARLSPPTDGNMVFTFESLC